MPMFHRFVLAAALLGVVGSTGCNSEGPSTYAVSGVVKHNGNPVEGAVVSFVPTQSTEDTSTAVGTTDASGKYVLTTRASGDGAIPGEYKVSIRKTEGGGGGTAAGGGAVSTDGEMPADYSGASDAPPPVTKDLLPAKYASPDTSGLTATVGNKAETFNFDLEGQ
jgi:hypothetical protein